MADLRSGLLTEEIASEGEIPRTVTPIKDFRLIMVGKPDYSRSYPIPLVAYFNKDDVFLRRTDKIHDNMRLGIALSMWSASGFLPLWGTAKLIDELDQKAKRGEEITEADYAQLVLSFAGDVTTVAPGLLKGADMVSKTRIGQWASKLQSTRGGAWLTKFNNELDVEIMLALKERGFTTRTINRRAPTLDKWHPASQRVRTLAEQLGTEFGVDLAAMKANGPPAKISRALEKKELLALCETYQCEWECVHEGTGATRTYKLYKGTERGVNSQMSPSVVHSVHGQPGHLRVDPSDADLIGSTTPFGGGSLEIVARNQSNGAIVSVTWTREECVELARLPGEARVARTKELVAEKLRAQGINDMPIGISNGAAKPLIK